MNIKECYIEDCHKEVRARGLCGTHWKRWRKTGDPLKCDIKDKILETRKTEKETGKRKCSLCKVNKNLEEFYKSRSAPLGRNILCKTCALEKTKKKMSIWKC